MFKTLNCYLGPAIIFGTTWVIPKCLERSSRSCASCEFAAAAAARVCAAFEVAIGLGVGSNMFKRRVGSYYEPTTKASVTLVTVLLYVYSGDTLIAFDGSKVTSLMFDDILGFGLSYSGGAGVNITSHFQEGRSTPDSYGDTLVLIDSLRNYFTIIIYLNL
ncbi:uncharacterized protein LOC111266423 [Varroa jacobsoni]|uniref:uncharacterized protein LOC111266423 n=1 Tax=Varroa jacobsoni TaxID=62625 RepID=UPI000BF34C2B|nr:uncharacterized protein LOC111266423 [Varroa jacobsoni]